ncbi:hypothetical protein OE88DRAFT_279396 [Heliocybe sulcata]|uniref:C2H2-type domain-containing protein n=1 Tax=Heliocybe sulcata TaxID=5364 RepID=A0A5C3N0S1_9AGAM|nr:hypothetical protein OE88DRAFT_279396 [Heliocybe sulcata]
MPVTIPLSDICQSHLAITFDNASVDGLSLRSMIPVTGAHGFGAKHGSLDGVYLSFSLVQGDHGLVFSVSPCTSSGSRNLTRTDMSASMDHVNTSSTYEYTQDHFSTQDNPNIFPKSSGGFDYALTESIDKAFTPAADISYVVDGSGVNIPSLAGEWSPTSVNVADNEFDYSALAFASLLTPSLLSDPLPAHHNEYSNHSSYTGIASTIDQSQDIMSSSKSSPTLSNTISPSCSSSLSSARDTTLPCDELIQFDSVNYYDYPSPDSTLGSRTTVSSPSPETHAPHASFSTFSSSGGKSGVQTSKPTTRKARRRRFQCLHPSCARLFTSEYTRRVHMSTHNIQPRKSLPCTMREETGCKEMFSRAHDRLRHEVAMHGKECEWVCNVCGRFFSTARMLEIHKCPGTVSGWIKARCPRILGEISSE